MIEVAVLLRGQARFAKEGAELWQRFVTERNPDFNFKFFTHSWDTLSIMQTTDARTVDTVPGREKAHILSTDEIHELLNYWNPTLFQIDSDTDNIDLAEQILISNIKSNEEVYDMVDNYIKSLDVPYSNFSKKLILPKLTPLLKNLPKIDIFSNKEINSLYNRENISNGYILGQVNSSGRSLKLLQEYIRQKNYVPDLIICTRYDIFVKFENLRKIYHIIKNYQSSSNPARRKNIFTHHLYVVNGISVPNDWIFIGDIQSFEGFLSNINERIVNKLTDNILNLFNLVKSGDKIQHALWFQLANADVNLTAFNDILWHAQILRKGYFDMKNITANDDESFKKAFDALQKFTYPKNIKHEISNKDIKMCLRQP